MADLLQQQYMSVFSQPTAINLDKFKETREIFVEMPEVSISEEDIQKSISTLAPNAAAGPDEVPAILLKNCSKALAVPLTLFWNNCI